MVSVKKDWQVAVSKIIDSQFVITSALSGIIVAEAYGILARLIMPPNERNTETLFKYTDYFHGTHFFNYRFATTIEEALEMGSESLPECELDLLLEALMYRLRKIKFFTLT